MPSIDVAIVAILLETFRMVLGEKLYKNYRSFPGDLLWVLTDTHLYIGDVSPHRTLLAMGSLVRDKYEGKEFKNRLMPLLKKVSKELDHEIRVVVAAGGCKLNGSDVVTSPGTFGLGDMKLSSELEAKILEEAVKHFRDYKVPSETGAYNPNRQD